MAEEGLALEVAEAPTSTSTSEEFVIPEAPPLEGDDSLTATAPASSPEDAPLDGTAVGDPFCQAEPPPTVFCQAEPPPTVEGDGGMVAAPVPLPDFSMPTVNTSQAHERSRSRLHPGRTSHAIAPVRCMHGRAARPLCAAFTAFQPAQVGPLADWRMAHDDMLAERAQREAAAIGEKQAQARVALEQFYADRKARSAAKAKSNQEEASAFTADQDATMQAESWQSVARPPHCALVCPARGEEVTHASATYRCAGWWTSRSRRARRRAPRRWTGCGASSSSSRRRQWWRSREAWPGKGRVTESGPSRFFSSASARQSRAYERECCDPS